LLLAVHQVEQRRHQLFRPRHHRLSGLTPRGGVLSEVLLGGDGGAAQRRVVRAVAGEQPAGQLGLPA
jgi:hypothetical protein